MTKHFQPAGLEELIRVATQRSVEAKKQASQFSPDSADNAESPHATEPKVSPKLQNTGEGYEPATISALGMERHRDLVRNQTDVPIPDKGVTADTSDALENVPADNPGVQTALMSAGDPTQKVVDPQTHSSEPSISEKLRLKKDAAAVMAKIAEVNTLSVSSRLTAKSRT